MCSVCLYVNEATWNLGWAKGTWKILEWKASVSTQTPSPGMTVPMLYSIQEAAHGGLPATPPNEGSHCCIPLSPCLPLCPHRLPAAILVPQINCSHPFPRCPGCPYPSPSLKCLLSLSIWRDLGILQAHSSAEEIPRDQPGVGGTARQEQLSVRPGWCT